MDDEMDAAIERLIDQGQDPTEMACRGVQAMIDGSIDQFSLRFGHTCSSDPALTIQYGERLFIRALDELKARRS